MVFPCPPATPTRATASPTNGFSRNTRHETRITAFTLFSLLSRALWRGIGRLWRGMGGRRPPHRQQACMIFTNHETRNTQHFSPALRRLQGEQPQARPTGFHESRNTKHESRLFFRRITNLCRVITGFCLSNTVFFESLRFFCPTIPHNPSEFVGIRRIPTEPLSARSPRWQHGLLGFHQPLDTKHVFPLPSGDFNESNRKPGQRVFTKHETRNTNHGFFSNHGFPTRDFPPFPTISHDFPAPPPPPSAVLARLPGARRQPQFPPASGLVPLRPRHNEPMLRKENILDCANSGTFYLALAIARLESPLRSGHHREQRRSGTVRGVTRSTTGRGLRRRDLPSGQETISKRR